MIGIAFSILALSTVLCVVLLSKTKYSDVTELLDGDEKHIWTIMRNKYDVFNCIDYCKEHHLEITNDLLPSNCVIIDNHVDKKYYQGDIYLENFSILGKDIKCIHVYNYDKPGKYIYVDENYEYIVDP